MSTSFSKQKLNYFDPIIDWYDIDGSSNYTMNNGKIPNNVGWNQEDLNMSVDLQVVIPSNGDCGQIDYHIMSEQLVDEKGFASLMQGNLNYGKQNYQTTDYTNISYQEIKQNKVVSKEDLGITSIDINFDAHFYPIVTIKMVDVRGSSLITPNQVGFDNKSVNSSINEMTRSGVDTSGLNADNSTVRSFFESLFRFPYPRFLLTVKGFYGSKITFTLSVSDFKTNFNSESGDFEITIKFIGYVYGLYIDLPLDLVMASPYYNSEYWETGKSENRFRFIEGSEMLTYPDLLRKIESIEDGMDENFAVSGSAEIEDYNNLNNNIVLIEDINGCIKKLLDSCEGYLNNGKFIGDKYYLFFLNNKLSFKDSDALTNYLQIKEMLNDDDINCLNAARNSFLKEDEINTGCVIYEVENLDNEIGEFKDFKDYFNCDESGYITFKTDELSKVISDNDTKLYEKITTTSIPSLTNNENIKFILYNKQVYDNFVTNRIKELEDKKKNVEKTTSDEIVNVYSDLLGFKPSVENIYRLLFAHIDCFMNFFYEKILNIINTQNLENKRIPSDLKLNYSNSDILKLDSNQTQPFPGYYVNKDGNRYIEYPGNAKDNPKLRQIHEVKKVNEICEAIINYREVIDDIIEIDENGDERIVDENLQTFSDIARYNFVDGISTFLVWKKLSDDFNTNNKNIATKEGCCILLYTILCEIIICCEVSCFVGSILQYNSTKSNEILKELVKIYVNRFLVNYNLSNTDINNISNIIREIIGKDYQNWFTTIKQILGCITVNVDGSNYEILKGPIHLFESNINGSNTFNYLREYLTINYSSPFISVVEKDWDFLDNIISLGVSKSYNSYNYSNNEMGLSVGLLDGYAYNKMHNIYRNTSENLIPKTWINLAGNNQYDGFNHLYDSNYFSNNGVLITDYDTNFINFSDEGDMFCGLLYTIEDKAFKRHYHIRNLLDYTNLKSILIGVCKNDYRALGYIILSSMVTAANFKSFIGAFNCIKKESKLFNVRLIDLLVTGAFLYRLDKGVEIFESDGSGDSNIGTSIPSNNRYIRPIIKEYGPLGVQVVNFIDSFYDEINTSTNNILSDIMGCRRYLKILFENWVDDYLQPFLENANNFDKKYQQTINWQIVKGPTEEYWYSNTFIYKKDSPVEKWFRSLYTDRVYVSVISSVPSSDKLIGMINKEIVGNIFNMVSENLPNINNENDDNTEDSTNLDIIGVDAGSKIKLYYVLKQLYNKWLSGYVFKNWKLNTIEKDLELRRLRFNDLKTANDLKNNNLSEYNNFLYINHFYEDISDKFIIDVNSIKKIIKEYRSGKLNVSVYQFLQRIAEENNLMFLSLPVFNNLYNFNEFKNIFTPNIMYGNNANNRGYGNTYVLIYTGESSKFSEIDSGDFNTDYCDLSRTLETNFPGCNDNSYSVSAFGVTFGKQNQMLFKKIDVGTDNPKMTNESINNLLLISDAGNTNGTSDTPSFVGQNLFSIYANRAYTCTIEMMGCMNIMPLMYFQLNNVPLFRGMYMIINVKHSIKAGDITTIFTGVRVGKYLPPEQGRYVISNTLFNKIDNSYKKDKGDKSGGDVYYKPGYIGKGVKKSVWNTLLTGNPETTIENPTKSYIISLLETVRIPIIKPDGTAAWRKVDFNKYYSRKLVSVFCKITCGRDLTDDELIHYIDKNEVPVGIADGYKLSNGERFKIKNDSTGTFCWRKIAGTDTLSNHSYGIAIDVNWNDNPNAKKSVLNNLKNKTTDNDIEIRTWNHPVVKAFLEEGFGWGIYKERLDYMHFSVDTSNYVQTATNKITLGNDKCVIGC